MKKTLSFDDVLLVPSYSDIKSRGEVDLSVDMGGNLNLSLPIVASPMDSVSEDEMALAMADAGGISIIHRYNTIERQVELIKRVIAEHYPINVGAAVGVTGDYLERAYAIRAAGVNTICVDIAHGHHTLMKEALDTLRNKFNNSLHIMAGNVATLEGFNDLADWGADIKNRKSYLLSLVPQQLNLYCQFVGLSVFSCGKPKAAVDIELRQL